MTEEPFYQRFAGRGCAVCGHDTTRLLFRQTFSQMSSGSLLQGYDVVVCDRCGFAFADHIPDQASFDAHYRDMSKYEYQDQGGQETEFDLSRFLAISEAIIPFLPGSGARVLDVGCATGRLLSLFQEKGFPNVIGLDPSPFCAQAAQRMYGVRVLTGSISSLTEAAATGQLFECAILSGVLEHLQDVVSALAQIRGVLAQGGLLFVEVPDATDFARWPDAPFQQFSTEHINFFSATSLENLLRRCGFVLETASRLQRDQTAGTVMPVVTAIFRKVPDLPSVAPFRDEVTEVALRAYIAKSQEVEDRLQHTIDLLVESAEPIIVWGVGTHTLHMLETSRLAQANIRAFVDSNARYQGKMLEGVPILPPSDLLARSEAILISSRVFQPAIERQIRQDLRLPNEIITLYHF
jgi:SAM-dependent methyltransferase